LGDGESQEPALSLEPLTRGDHPPSTSAEAVAIVCLHGVGLIITGTAWVDRHREGIAG